MSEKYPPLTKEKRAAYLRILHEPHAPMPSRYTVFVFEATVCDLEIQLAEATEERDAYRELVMWWMTGDTPDEACAKFEEWAMVHSAEFKPQWAEAIEKLKALEEKRAS